MEYLHMLVEVIKNTLTITCLVMMMLLLIEFINVRSSGKIMERLKNHPFRQILVAALLGLIPGCIGGFSIVSLFIHDIFTFGALVAGMISTFGDEAFVIFAYSPKWTFILAGALVVIGVITGVITDLFIKKTNYKLASHSFEIHDDHEHMHSAEARLSYKNLKKISFPRASILFGLVIYLAAILTGTFSHEHGGMPDLQHHDTQTECADTHCSSHDHHDHDHHHETETVGIESAEHAVQHAHSHGVFSSENIIFMLLALLTLVIVALSSEHFLQSHLWEHVIKQHFISVLLWTFGVLLSLQLLYHFVDVNALLAENQWAMLVILLLAVLIGIIPESGPHLIFVVMFFSGAIPFSILLASSVVQDGHGALPLLAQSRKNFLLMKAINVAVGLLIGLLGFFIGF